jgi:hypothetical protein
MHCKHMNTGSFVRRSFFLLAGCLLFFGLGTSVKAQIATLNVTNFGAIGDCANITVSVTSNSAVVVTTNQFSSADVGKVVQLFGAGYFAKLTANTPFFGNYRGTPTNHQDLVATILSVADGTNVTISSFCGVTATNLLCTYGTQNKTAFDNCIAAAPNPCTIQIPAGNYMLIPPTALDTNFVQPGYLYTYPTITLRKGGIHFLGDGTNLTILTGNGAWQQKGQNTAYRGYMFEILSPITNNGALTFDGIQFNGNAVRNHSPYTYYPATPTDGTGWDDSHHCIVGVGTAPIFTSESYTNCFFTHWHGEIIYEQLSITNGFVDVGNCTFVDGNATALNISYSHNYHDSFFSDLDEVEENYEAYASTPSFFQNNIVTNMFGALIALNGALSNSINPTYTIRSNLFYTSSGNGIQTTPACNVIISRNTFIGNGGGFAVVLSVAGYQGSTINSNIVVEFNTFTNVYYGFVASGGGGNVANVQVNSNSFYGAPGTSIFANGNGWSTNVSLRGNFATNCWAAIDGRTLAGQWFLDDASNLFPPWSQTDSTGKTNTITYATGMKQQITPYVTNSVWAIDDAHPQKIPPGAVLQITHTGNFPAPVFASTTKIVLPTVLTPGQMVMYRWTNSVWKKISFLIAPTGLLAGPTNAP